MFNNHLSYAELSSVLYQATQEKRLLTKSEINCLNKSLQDVMLRELLILYPLTKKSEQLVTESVHALQASSQNQEIEIDVHSSLYGGVREKTAAFLEEKYPVIENTTVIKKLKKFFTDFIDTSEAKQALLLSEQERYSIRVKMHELKILVALEPMQTFDGIKADFISYQRHLENQHDSGSTYGWKTLASIFLRIESPELTETERKESELLLLRALDDSRTAYHDKSQKFIPGKNYTCQKGFAERLLDHYYAIISTSQPSEHILSTSILSLTQPFILRSPSMQEEDCRATYSEALYALYLECAGYEMTEKQRAIFVFTEGFCIQALTQEYLSCFKTHSPIMLLKLRYDFESALGLIRQELLSTEDLLYTEALNFLRSKNLIETKYVTQVELAPPHHAKNKEDILHAMMEKGPFIDRAHLELVLALHDSNASLETLEQSAKNGTQVTSNPSLPSQREMFSAYRHYLSETGEDFYHFFDENFATDRLQEKVVRSICFSQAALCEYLNRWLAQLSKYQCEKIAVLCCKAGYAQALNILLQKIDPHYIEHDEGFSLIHIAAIEGHHDTAFQLLEAGVSPNLSSRQSLSPLQIASARGHQRLVELLVNFHADINYHDPKDKFTALHFAAARGFHDIIKILLRAQAIVDLKTANDETALHLAIGGNHLASVKILLQAGANPNIEGGFKTQTPLYIATSGLLSEMIQPLLDAGALPDTPHGRWHKAAIHKAAALGLSDIVQSLLSAGSNPNLPDKWHNTPLSIALERRHFEVVLLLLAAGAVGQVNVRWLNLIPQQAPSHILSHILEELTPESTLNTRKKQLIEAIATHDLTTMCECLDAGVNINNTHNNRCALDIAIEYKNRSIIETLVKSSTLNPYTFIQILQRAITERRLHDIVPYLLREDLIDIFIKTHPKNNLEKWASDRGCLAAANKFKERIKERHQNSHSIPIIYSNKAVARPSVLHKPQECPSS